MSFMVFPGTQGSFAVVRMLTQTAPLICHFSLHLLVCFYLSLPISFSIVRLDFVLLLQLRFCWSCFFFETPHVVSCLSFSKKRKCCHQISAYFEQHSADFGHIRSRCEVCGSWWHLMTCGTSCYLLLLENNMWLRHTASVHCWFYAEYACIHVNRNIPVAAVYVNMLLFTMLPYQEGWFEGWCQHFHTH